MIGGENIMCYEYLYTKQPVKKKTKGKNTMYLHTERVIQSIPKKVPLPVKQLISARMY